MRRTIVNLLEDEEFKKFWGDVCRGIDSFRVEEAVLDFIYRPKQRAGTTGDINAQAAMDMHHTDGALELWEKLTGLLYETVAMSEGVEDDESSI